MIKTVLRKLLKNEDLIEPIEFIIKAALVYAFWRVLKYSGETYPGFMWGGWAAFYDFMGNLLANCTAILLDILGYRYWHEGRVIIIEGTRGVRFADLCLGIAPIVIYTGIITSFGDNWAARSWYIPMGIVFIFMINVLRMLALILVQAHYPQYFELVHEYVYLIVTYSLIFALVALWMDKFAFKTSSSGN